MNILLVAPATGSWRRIARRRTFNGRTFRFSMLSLLTVAALSPKGSKVTIIDEQVDDIPEEPFDLVGITAMTALAPRAYEICAYFKAKGVPVVMGGFHATLNTAEALEHANAVVAGPAYGAWERVCRDVEAGCLQRIYRGRMDGVPVHLPRYLLDDGKYVTVGSTFATLGCRNRCRFCSIHPFHGGERYARPVAEVVEELAAVKQRFFLFVDDNLTQDRDYALELFRALKPLGKCWATQATLNLADDEEMLRAMSESGCLGVFVGLETFNPESLEAQSKSFNLPQRYREAIARFHGHGMFVEAGVMVGFDSDGPGVFRETIRQLDRCGIDAIQLSILTPLPGTQLFEDMGERVIDRDWEHYDFRHAVFKPSRMSAETLQDGADWMIHEFYRPWRIARRLARWLCMAHGWRRFVYPLGLNLAYLGRTISFGIKGKVPGNGPLRGEQQIGGAPAGVQRSAEAG